MGGLCDDDFDMDVNYAYNIISFVDVIRFGRIRAETTFIEAVGNGFRPKDGAIVSVAIEECFQFLEMIQKGNFRLSKTHYEKSIYLDELCRVHCETAQTNTQCVLSEEINHRFTLLIEKAKEMSRFRSRG